MGLEMFDINRLKRLLTRSRLNTPDEAFEYYYGSILFDRQASGISAREAHRDFEKIRRAVDRTSAY
jgi:hypothetical protein